MGGSSRCTSNGPAPYFGSVPVWARYIIITGIQQRCQYRYWHYTLVQYQYGHVPLLVLASQHGAHTGTGIFTLWFSTGIGTVHYRYWHSIVPIPVMANMYLESVPVWAHSITGTGIQLCPYQYPVLAFLHFGSVSVLARSITGTGIKH
jgi:hypothetical protein